MKNLFIGKVGETLTDKLNREDPYLKNKILDFWNDYCIGLKSLYGSDCFLKDRMGLLWRDDFLIKADRFEGDIKTYFKNVIKAMHRKYHKST